MCSVSVVGEVGDITLASKTAAGGGGLVVTSPVVFSSVDTSLLTTISPPEEQKKSKIVNLLKLPKQSLQGFVSHSSSEEQADL